MRILHVTHSVDPRSGGPTYVVRKIVRGQVRAGHQVSLLATTVQSAEPWAPADEYKTKMLADPDFSGAEVYLAAAYGRHRPWSRYGFSPQSARWLRRRLSDPRLAPEVIDIHGVFSHVTSQAARQARRHSVPYVMQPFGALDARLIRTGRRRLKGAFTRLFLEEDLRRAACVHPASLHEAHSVRRWVPDKHIQVVPHGVDLPPAGTAQRRRSLFASFPQLRGKRVVLFMSRVTPKKRPELIVEAIARLRPQYPNLALLVAGQDDGHLAVLRAAAQKHGLAGSVVYLGFVQGELKRAAFAVADLMALPSIDENFAVAVIEAMAYGVPALVTPGVAAHVFVDQSGAGLTVEGTAQALAQGMRKLLESDRARLGRMGRQFVKQHLSWTAVIRQLDRVYRDAMAQDRTTSTSARRAV